ncbi:hypothetical protein BXY57_1958 [Thermoflavifilum aggregans]|uniref:Uncharacterized protein n=1 Tax=Thermoflavifilum aggregans TaxID=454188 RepID=A0A2M9CWP1_9BACT|nr:hypothetical protein BXY57_1958 [Thermoflavifilum aggregans]
MDFKDAVFLFALFALLLFNHPNQVVKSYTKGCVYKDSVDIEPTYGDKFFLRMQESVISRFMPGR